MGDLLPFAVGMAVSPQATVLTLLWLTTTHGRLKVLALMFGVITSTAAALCLLVALDDLLGESLGPRQLAVVAGILSIALGFYSLAQVFQVVRRLLRGEATLRDLRRVPGLSGKLEHAGFKQVFRAGGLAALSGPQTPQSLVLAAFIIALHALRPSLELAVILAYAGIVGLGVAVFLAIAFLPGRRLQAWLLGFRSWMEANGGFVVLGANALMAVVLFWKGFAYLHYPR
ncbi:MAG TPA: GAP family protein [Oscillatoriaceae cyanobacterium]